MYIGKGRKYNYMQDESLTLANSRIHHVHRFSKPEIYRYNIIYYICIYIYYIYNLYI